MCKWRARMARIIHFPYIPWGELHSWKCGDVKLCYMYHELHLILKNLFHSFSLKGFVGIVPSQLVCYSNRTIMLSALQRMEVHVKGHLWIWHFFWQAWCTYILLTFVWNRLEFEFGGSINWSVESVKSIFWSCSLFSLTLHPVGLLGNCFPFQRVWNKHTSIF